MKRYKVIACEVLSRELYYCASMSDNIIDLYFLPKGLHDMGAEKMQKSIQDAIDNVDVDQYDAIILGFGLCNNGIIGLKSKLPLIVTRAHDCITLLMGSRQAYASYFEKNPNTFYESPGWLERDINPNATQGSITQSLGMNIDYSQYDEETAAFLKESLGDWMRNYKKIAYIDSGIGNPDQYIRMARQKAQSKNFEFEILTGSLKLFTGLLDGDWNEHYLVVMPGEEIVNSYDGDIVKSGSDAQQC